MHRILSAMVLSLGLLVVHVASASPVQDAMDIQRAEASFLLQTTQTPIPTTVPGGSEAPAPNGPPLSLTLILLALCCAFFVLIGVVVLGFVVRRENRPVAKNE